MDNDNLKNKILLHGFGGKGGKKQQVRYPSEQEEGVNTSSFPRTTTNLKDFPGAVSLTKIEVFDLLGEGEQEGLVTGDYSYIGTLGNVGWDQVLVTGYAAAPGTDIHWARSVYWNEVPVVNTRNEYNFQSVELKYTPGYPDGSLSNLLTNELTTSRGIGERLRYGYDFGKTYRLYNKDIKAFEVNVRFNQLSKTNVTPEEYGDTEETTVTYWIQWKPIYSTVGKTPNIYPNSQFEEVRGKISQGYIRTTRISLFSTSLIYDADFVGWEINIYRSTPDSTNNQVRNQSYIDSITEVFGDTFVYPNSAIASARFSAEYFSQIPSRAFDCKLLKVKVPSNYDGLTKQYTSDWDGTFKEDKEWTDNPAWCFYDLITNKRYGLGRYIDEDQIDKWTLYQIARYCDTLVPNGEGGLEPRFTCNLLITSREEAYKVINDMASIFRAMTYYFAGSIYAVQDAFKSPIYQFTNANIENGDFQYSSSSRRVRHTVAIIRYNDKTNFYKPAVEYVEDVEGIRKYGIREVELTAFGCTSRGQALRLGRWALVSENAETESVSFVAGLEGNYLRPGDVIQVQDNNRTIDYWGGRVHTVYDSGHFLLDREITGLESSNLYYLSLLTPTFNYDVSQVDVVSSANEPNIRRKSIQKTAFGLSHVSGATGIDGVVRTDLQLPIGARFDVTNYTLTGNPVWMIEGSGISNKFYDQWDYYRVLRIEEQNQNKFAISAIQYASGKFDSIDSGVNFQESSYGTSVPNEPLNLKLKEVAISTFSKKIDYTFTIASIEGVNSFRVYVKFGSDFVVADLASNNNTYLIATLQANERGGSYIPAENGTYYFRVYSANRFGTVSTAFAAANITIQGIAKLRNLIVGGLVLEEEAAETSIVGGNKKSSEAVNPETLFKWQLGLSSYGQLPTGNFYYRFTAREPANGNTPSSNVYFEQTGLLKDEVTNLNYRFDFYNNVNSVSTLGVRGPFRNYDAVVEGHLGDGTSTAGGNFVINNDSDYSNSNGYDILAVSNPPIPSVVLTENASSDTTSWQTEQWISPEGEIKLRFLKSSFPPDLGGAYAYYSTDAFNKVEALNIASTNKVINKALIFESGNPFVIQTTTLTGASEAYFLLSLFDLFDAANLATGKYIEDKINMSNIVKINKRSDIALYSDAFYYAWIEVSIAPTNASLSLDWVYKNYGISNVSFGENNQSSSDFVFTFAKPLPNTNYVVHATSVHDSNFIGSFVAANPSIPGRLIEKATTYFRYQVTPSLYFNGAKTFLGVLYNKKANNY